MPTFDRSEYAKWDFGHVADGLFVPMKGRAYKKLKTDATHTRNGYTLRFIGFEPLGGFDQSVLLSLAAQTGEQRLVITPETEGAGGKQLRLALAAKGVTEDVFAGAASTSLYRVLLDAGVDPEDTRNLRAVRASLTRLANIQIVVHAPDGRQGQQNVLAYQVAPDGTIRCALNWRLTEAILGDLQHARVSLVERTLLKSEIAKLLHCWLSSHVDPGKELANGRGAHVDTLLPHVWGPEALGVSKQMLSRRRKALVAAAGAIGGLSGWRADVTGRGLVLLTRPRRLPVFRSPSHQQDEDRQLMVDIATASGRHAVAVDGVPP